jgi:phage terminase small subunit
MNYLNKRGKEIYKEIEKHCKAQGFEDKIFSHKLGMVASALSVFEENAAFISKEGSTQKTPSGYTQVRGEFTAMNQAFNIVQKMGGDFGLDPISLAKMLKDKPATNDYNALAEFVG